MSGYSDPDRDGTDDPGHDPAARRRILDRETAALQRYQERGI